MHCSLALPTTVYSDAILTLQLCFLCGEVYMYICYCQNDWIQACLDLLHFIVLHSYCSFCCCFVCFALYCFYQLEGFWQPCIKQVYKVYWCHFPTAFAHFVSLCHILVILTIFQTFSLLLYLLCWSVIRIFDVTTVIVWGYHKPCLFKVMNLMINVCVLTASLTGCPLPSSGLPISWDKTIWK